MSACQHRAARATALAAAAPDLIPHDTLNYGGDNAGLICGFLFDCLRDAAPVAVDSASAATWLDRHAEVGEAAGAGPPYDGFLWLHFNLSHAPAEPWIQRHARLPDSFFEALKGGSHSTRIERDEDTLVAVINDVRFDFGFEPSDIATLWISVGPRLVVTARKEALRSVDALRTAVRNGEPLRSSVALLEQLMRKQADGMVAIVRDATSRVDDIEDDLLAGRLDTKRVKLGQMRRLLVRLQRLLAPEPAALFRLLQHPPAWMGGEDVEQLRASTEEFSVVLRDMVGLQERIKLLQEEIAATVNEDNNKSLFVLTVVTVLALPINIMAGLFGMNVGGVPLSDHPHGFWIVVSIVVGVTAIAGWVSLRKKD